VLSLFTHVPQVQFPVRHARARARQKPSPQPTRRGQPRRVQTTGSAGRPPHIFGVPGPPAPIIAPISLMSEKSKRNLVKPRSRPFRSGWSPPSAGLSGSRGFSRAAIRACRRLRPEVGREGDHGVARSGRVRASLASVPRSALADAFGPRSAARAIMAWLDLAECGLRWLLCRPRSALADAFGPRSAARLSATSGLGRWFLPRARTRVADGKLDLSSSPDPAISVLLSKPVGATNALESARE
jgi:hypothetical protein